jgi:hypothetical protein
LAHLQRLRRNFEVILGGDPSDQVHDIGDAAGAFAALLEFAINLSRNNDLPRIVLQETAYYAHDFLVGDDVAMADEHARLYGGVKLNVNVMLSRGSRGGRHIA